MATPESLAWSATARYGYRIVMWPPCLWGLFQQSSGVRVLRERLGRAGSASLTPSEPARSDATDPPAQLLQTAHSDTAASERDESTQRARKVIRWNNLYERSRRLRHRDQTKIPNPIAMPVWAKP